MTDTATAEVQTPAVTRCTHGAHPRTPHLHWDPGAGVITYSSVGYRSTTARRIDGTFGKGEHVTEEAPAVVADPTPATNGQMPQWPIVLCTFADHPNTREHYHVRSTMDLTYGDPPPAGAQILYGTRVYEGMGYRTRQGLRFSKNGNPPREGETPTVPVSTEWAPGQKYRVTSDRGGHQFPVGTIVTAIRNTGYGESRNRLAYFHATTRDDVDPEVGAPQNVGTTAWVYGTTDYEGYTNVERAPEFEDTGLVRECDVEEHPETEHAHWRFRGGPVVATPVDWTAQARRWHRAGTFAKGEHLVSHSVTLDEEPTEVITDRVENLPVPPAEVLRMLREHPEDHRPRAVQRAGTIERLIGEVAAATEVRDAARQERAQWMNEVITVSRRYASDQAWCGVYDQAMVSLGLPNRHDSMDPDPDEEEEPETEEVSVTATVTVTIPMDDDDVEQWIADRYYISTADLSDTSEPGTITTRISVTTTYEVDTGSCGCDEITWDEHLPAWVRDNGLDWEVVDEECSND